MKEKLKNKKVVYTIIGIVSVLLVALAVTYAYWLVTKTQTGENEITAGCLDITISGEKNDIEVTNQFPMSDEDGMKLVPYEFTVTNNCNTSVDYQVALEATGDSSNALKGTSLKVALNDSYKLYSVYSSVETTIDGAYESRVLGYSRLAASGNEGSSDTYSLRIWIDKDAPISEMNKTFKSKISVTIGQGIESPYEEGTLAYSILSNAGGVNTTSEIDASVWNHTVTATGDQSFSTSNNYYFGTEYTFDKATGKYTLSGTLTQATTTECRNGTKTCGKYTLKNTSSTYSSTTLYEVTDFQSSGNYVTANTWKYVNAFSKVTDSSEAGLYKTQDDLGDSYYFRGAPTNNYVQFGKLNYYDVKDQFGTEYESLESCEKTELDWCVEDGDGTYFTFISGVSYNSYEECEKHLEQPICTEINNPSIYWRIVRINGDGTIRLVYDGVEKVANGVVRSASIGKTAYNTSWDSAKYAGYTYDDGTGTQVDSAIKTALDTWYDTHLEVNYGRYIADSIFCNDRSETGYAYLDADFNTVIDPTQAVYTYIYYGSNSRLTNNKAPNLKCTNKSDRYTVDNTINGNGLLSNPVGLISADEVAFAGGNNLINNKSYYLYSGEYFWTSTPHSFSDTSCLLQFEPYVWTVSDNGELRNDYAASVWHNVRPVINLKDDVKFTGDGTIDNPYKIVTE